MPVSLSFRDLTRDRQTDDRQTRRPFHKALTFTACEPSKWRRLLAYATTWRRCALYWVPSILAFPACLPRGKYNVMLLLFTFNETNYPEIYWTAVHRIFRIDRHMGGDDESVIRFAITQGTWLWQPILSRIGIPHLHSLLWHFTTDWSIATPTEGDMTWRWPIYIGHKLG